MVYPINAYSTKHYTKRRVMVDSVLNVNVIQMVLIVRTASMDSIEENMIMNA